MPRTFADYLDGYSVAVNQTTATPIYAPVGDLNAVQVYIRPSSTEQIFTVTLLSGKTVECHLGSFFNFKSRRAFAEGTHLFDVTTATSGAVLQVLGFRE